MTTNLNIIKVDNNYSDRRSNYVNSNGTSRDIIRNIIDFYKSIRNIIFNNESLDLCFKPLSNNYLGGNTSAVLQIRLSTQSLKYKYLEDTDLVIKLFYTRYTPDDEHNSSSDSYFDNPTCSVGGHKSDDIRRNCASCNFTINDFYQKYLCDKESLPSFVPDIYFMGNVFDNNEYVCSYLIMKKYIMVNELSLSLTQRINVAYDLTMKYKEIKDNNYIIRDLRMSNIGINISLSGYSVYLIDYEYDTLINPFNSFYDDYCSNSEYMDDAYWALAYMVGYYYIPYFAFKDINTYVNNGCIFNDMFNIDRLSFGILLYSLLTKDYGKTMFDNFSAIIYNLKWCSLSDIDDKLDISIFFKISDLFVNRLNNTNENKIKSGYNKYLVIKYLIRDSLTPYLSSNEYDDLSNLNKVIDDFYYLSDDSENEEDT